MKDLLSEDVGQLLTTVAELNSQPEERDISERILNAVGALVPNDLIALDSFADDEVLYPYIHWNSNAQVLTQEIEEICAAVFQESPGDNPLIGELVIGKNQEVLKLSDFSERGRFKRTAYYNEIMRRVGFDRQMGVMLPLNHEVSFSCAVQRRGSDFTERERQLLAALSPHLTNALSESMRRRRMLRETERLEKVLETGSQGVIVLSRQEKIIQSTRLASRLIQDYFHFAIPEDGLPPEVAGWLRTNAGDHDELTVQRGNSTLCIKAGGHNQRGEIALSLEERLAISPEIFESIGLTARQSEVLFWMWKGKTNSVIAELIGASRRTVEKHVQLIFEKLGVESRTAAVAVAVQRIENTFSQQS